MLPLNPKIELSNVELLMQTWFMAVFHFVLG